MNRDCFGARDGCVAEGSGFGVLNSEDEVGGWSLSGARGFYGRG